MRRSDCHDRIKQARSSCETACRTVLVLIRLAEEQPELLYNQNLDMADIKVLPDELRDVYFVRMFACFESDLRHYWQKCVKDTVPPTKQLLSSIAGRIGLAEDKLDAVQAIRAYRNYLVHEQHEKPEPITIDQASGDLNTFIARLPRVW
jgi:hypothetical protein